jgi:hypothetical protein
MVRHPATKRRRMAFFPCIGLDSRMNSHPLVANTLLRPRLQIPFFTHWLVSQWEQEILKSTMPPRNPVCRGRCKLLDAPVRPYAKYDQSVVLQIAGGTPLVIVNSSFFMPPFCEQNSEWVDTIVNSGNIIVSFRISLRRKSKCNHVWATTSVGST